MYNLIKKILVEWSYRLDDGIIDLENYKHLSILREVLSDMELSSEVIIEVMSNITEKEKEWFYAIKKDTNKKSRSLGTTSLFPKSSCIASRSSDKSSNISESTLPPLFCVPS